MISNPRFSGAFLILVTAAGCFLSEPAAGDWLVTHKGARVETRGAWEVKGKLVVFQSTKAVLSSLSLDAIDLEASTALTEAAKRAAEAPVPEPRETDATPVAKAKFVLTDADVGHVDSAMLPEAQEVPTGPAVEPEQPQAGSAKEAASKNNPLEVISWDAVLGAGATGVSVRGVVGNPSELFASDIKIEVTLLSLEGTEIEAGFAKMKVNALGPGEQGPFEALFPSVFSVGKALFEVTSFNAKPSEREQPAI